MLPIILLCLALTAPSLADALGPGFLRAGLTARVGHPVLRPGKRQVVGSLTRMPDTSYSIDLQIGTPPQTITVIIDTGSPDLFVNPVCANAGPASLVASCSKITPFEYPKSSTFRNVGSAGQLTFAQGAALVEWVSDVLTIGSATIKTQIFGLTIQSKDLAYGFMGLSPPLFGTSPYPYALDSMVKQGLIASRAFSLDLNAADTKSGSLIFGGVDTGKFIGALAKTPILPRSSAPNGLAGYWVQLTGVGITTPDGVSHTSPITPIPVLLDSGTTVTMLPTAVFVALGQLFSGAQYDPASGLFVVDCSNDGAPGTVDFTFGGKVIRVPYSDLIWNGGGQCLLVVKATNDSPILGTSFLRSAYVVYDLDNSNVHLAQAANCGTSVIAISTGTDAVPSSAGACAAQSSTSQVSATATVSLADVSDVSDTSVSPTATYTGAAISTPPLEAPGPQLSDSSVPASSLPTVCTTCGTGTATAAAATSTSSGGAEPLRMEAGALGAVALAVLAAWGL